MGKIIFKGLNIVFWLSKGFLFWKREKNILLEVRDILKFMMYGI